MNCLGCNLIEVAPVKLNTGETVCSSCPEWMMECEARSVLRLELSKRREYLVEAEKKRGFAATEKLKDAMKAEWEKRDALPA